MINGQSANETESKTESTQKNGNRAKNRVPNMSTVCNVESVPPITTQRNTAPIAQKKLVDEKNGDSVLHVDWYYIQVRLLYPL